MAIEEIMGERHPTRTRPPGWGLPIGVGAGAALGLVVGILFEQLALGMAFGASLGLIVGATSTGVQAVPANRRGTVVATAIAILAAGLVATVLILTSP